jgi:hypothetical protein
MPMFLLWAAPAAIMISSVGSYLIAVANVADGAIALTAPAPMPLAAHPKLKVIQGGKCQAG